VKPEPGGLPEWPDTTALPAVRPHRGSAEPGPNQRIAAAHAENSAGFRPVFAHKWFAAVKGRLPSISLRKHRFYEILIMKLQGGNQSMKLATQILARTLAVASGLVLASGAFADRSSYKCGMQAMVHKGDSTAQVRARCGEPEFRDAQILGSGAEERVESWTYKDYNKRGWMTELRFRNGKLVAVESLGKVR